MNRIMLNHRYVGALLAATVVCLQWSSPLAQSEDVRKAEPLEVAAQMVRLSGSPGGICAVVGSADAELALAVAKQGSFVVHCLSMEPTVCDPNARRTMPAATAAAEPMLEPPGVCSRFQGLVVEPGSK